MKTLSTALGDFGTEDNIKKDYTMNELITYKSETETSEGTFKTTFGGVEYTGYYEGVIETTTEWSSEFGCMGVTNQEILEDTIHITSEASGVENLVCRDDHEEIYEWVYNNVDLLDVWDNSRWTIEKPAPKIMMARYLLDKHALYFPHGYLNAI